MVNEYHFAEGIGTTLITLREVKREMIFFAQLLIISGVILLFMWFGPVPEEWGRRPKYWRRFGVLTPFLIVVIIFMLGYFIRQVYLDNVASEKIIASYRSRVTAVNYSEVNEVVQTMLKAKILLRVDSANCEAFIDTDTWLTVDYDTKRKIGYAVANYCADKAGHRDTVYATLRDHHTGNSVGKYSQAWGFKVIER